MNTQINAIKRIKLQNFFKRTALLPLIVFMTFTNIFAQSSAYSGKEFLVAFGMNDNHSSLTYINDDGKADTVQLILRITSIEAANVSIKFKDNPALNANFLLQANEIYDYILSYNQTQASYMGSAGASGTKSNKSISVSSTGKISLIAMNTALRSTEATMVMPIENLGTEYRHSGLIPASSRNTGLLIIATEDNTEVNFAHTSNGAPGKQILQKGEVYAYYYSASGLVGMTVTSNNPIAYFMSAPQVMLSETSGGRHRENFNFEQLIPMKQWGTKFIVPTVLEPYHQTQSIFARIVSKASTNNISIKYTDGSTQKITTWYGDIRIDQHNHNTAKAAYIEAETPISVLLIYAPYNYSNDVSQPGAAWLPPVEQTLTSALIAPFDLDSRHVYLQMEHDFIIITPTATKDQTKISINGGQPQSLHTDPKFKWVVDNVGGSGYAFGRYQFGHHDPHPQHPVFLNTTALVENPAGILLLAYGQGGYTNYFYAVGAAARCLDMAFFINDIQHDDARGQTFCASNYQIRAESSLPNSQPSGYPKWKVDNQSQAWDGQGLTNPIITTLNSGEHTIQMFFKNANGDEKSRSTTFTVENPLTISAFTLPAFCNESIFKPLVSPVVTGGIALSKGWQLETGVGTNQYKNIDLSYQVVSTDNNKRVRYYAEGECGVVYSATQTIVINPPVTPSVKVSAEKI